MAFPWAFPRAWTGNGNRNEDDASIAEINNALRETCKQRFRREKLKRRIVKSLCGNVGFPSGHGFIRAANAPSPFAVNSSNVTATRNFSGGRSFSCDITDGAQRVPLAVPLPRAFHLRPRQTRQSADLSVPQMPAINAA